MSARSSNKPSTGTLLPSDVYASQVEALYGDASSLTVGVLAAFLTTASTGLLTGDWPIGEIAVALAVLGLVRLHFMRRFWDRRSTLDHGALRRWEKGYVLGGSLHLALLGLFCIAAFTRSEDAFARLASLSITMAYLIGTPGRSFASNLLVDAQILVSAVPLTLSLMIAGPRYWLIILFVILPFFIALKTISARLRGIFQTAVLRARDLGILAERFDTALTNMPHGLAMFAADGFISVANARFGLLLDAKQDDIHDHPIDQVLQAFEACSDGAGAPHRSRIGATSPVSPRFTERWISTRNDGCSVSFTVQGMADGGGVIIAEDVTEQVRAQASLAFLARYDKLTGLPNRHGFQEALAARLRDGAKDSGALMFIDLDRFKGVNDTLGHVIGDSLLSAVAERLRSATDPETLLARFGGDEFVLYRAFTDVRTEAAELAERIIARVSEPFDIEGHRILIGATIGIASETSCGSDVDGLLRDGDLALYRAKAEQKGTFRFFEDEMQAAAAARRDLESDLRSAIELGQMSLHFQPIVDIVEGRAKTCEALLRWQHPVRGPVSPITFIGIAEETGYIWELGCWVLEQACRECVRWPSHVGVAVNVSALQFQRGDLAEAALRAAIAAGLSPNRLEIEITETALLRNLTKARSQLLRLQHFGFRLALDDFGTGFSSLSYLQRLPFDKVKLDRSFLIDTAGDGRGLKVLNGVARLCADLGLTVVMEGVETSQQLDLVTEIGIVEIQGYLISRPVAAEQVRAFLRQDFRADLHEPLPALATSRVG